MPFSGELFKKVKKSLAGTFGFSGSVSSNFNPSAVSRSLSGALSFAGSVFVRLQDEMAGNLGFSGQLSRTLALSRSYEGYANFSGNLSTRAYLSRQVVGSFNCSGVSETGVLKFYSDTGVLSLFSGSVSTIYIEGEELDLKGLYKMGSSLRMR